MSMVADIVTWMRGRRSGHYFWGLVPQDHILDADFAKGEFHHGASYLKLRLAEMHLEYEREAWFEFLPLCLIAADYYYDGQSRSMPFLVSHELLKEALAKANAKNEPIELLSTTLLGPVPFVAGDIGLAVALFRTERSDLVELLLDVLGGFGTDIGPNPVTDALPMAGHIYSGVKRLFGMDSQVQFRFGMRDEFRAGPGGGKPLGGSYLVATGASDAKLTTDQLWVQNGRLRKGQNKHQFVGEIGHDFCLVAIEHHATRGHYGDLPFHKLWEEIPEMVWSDQIERAEKYAFLSLGKAIATSPDLIQTDKTAAILQYRQMFDAEIERFQQARRQLKEPTVTRGGGAEVGGALRLRRLASRTEKTLPQVGTILRAAADQLEANPEAFGAPGTNGARVDTTDRDWRNRFDRDLAETRSRLAAAQVQAEDLLANMVDQAYQA